MAATPYPPRDVDVRTVVWMPGVTVRGVVTAALALALGAGQLAALEPSLTRELRGLLAAEVGRRQFTVVCTGGQERSLRGERVHPRWPLERERLVDTDSGELTYERYATRGGRAIAREGSDSPWTDLEPGTALPDPFSLPRALLEAMLVAASDGAGRPSQGETTLELDGFLTELVARTVLEGAAKLRFDGRRGTVTLERPGIGVWRVRCRMSGALDGEAVELEATLLLDGTDGVLPYDELPVEVGERLGLNVLRPGQFKVSPRVVDHYTPERIETELWVWFSDHQGGLAAEGQLYQFETRRIAWRDQEGRPLTPALLGLRPDELQGARISWRFDDLDRRGIEELHLEMELTLNFYPVTVRAAWARGGGIHENERAWMPMRPPETEVGSLPEGIREIRRR